MGNKTVNMLLLATTTIINFVLSSTQTKLFNVITTPQPLIAICPHPKFSFLIGTDGDRFYTFSSIRLDQPPGSQLVDLNIYEKGNFKTCIANIQRVWFPNKYHIGYIHLPYPSGLFPDDFGNPKIWNYPTETLSRYELGVDIANTSLFLVVQTEHGGDGIYTASRYDFNPPDVGGRLTLYNQDTKAVSITFKNGTSHFIVGYLGGEREIFDHSNPNFKSKHPKLHGATKTEYFLTSGDKNYNYYISGLSGAVLEIVKFTDVTDQNEKDISGYTGGLLDMKTFKSSQYLVILPSDGQSFAVINYVDLLENIHVTIFGDAGGLKYKLAVLSMSRLVAFSDVYLNKIMIYEIKQSPCHPTCKTCTINTDSESCTSCFPGDSIQKFNTCKPGICQLDEYLFEDERGIHASECRKCRENCLACFNNHCHLCQNEDNLVDYLGDCIDCVANPTLLVCNYVEIIIGSHTKELDPNGVLIFLYANINLGRMDHITVGPNHDYTFNPSPWLTFTYIDSETNLNVTYTEWISIGSKSKIYVQFQGDLPKTKELHIKVQKDQPWLFSLGHYQTAKIVPLTIKIPYKFYEDRVQEGLLIRKKSGDDSSKNVSPILQSTGLITAGLGFIFNKVLFFLVKYFQILGIVSNFEMINVDFGEKLTGVFGIIGAIEIPGLPASSFNLVSDDEAHLKYLRGTRGKLGQSNEDSFILHETNGVYSFITIICWSILMIKCPCPTITCNRCRKKYSPTPKGRKHRKKKGSFEIKQGRSSRSDKRATQVGKKEGLSERKQLMDSRRSNKGAKVNKIQQMPGKETQRPINKNGNGVKKSKKSKQRVKFKRDPFIYWVIHTLFMFVYDINYFDFQFIASSELAYHDFNIKDQPLIMLLSPIISFILLVIILINLTKTWLLVRSNPTEKQQAKLSYFQNSLYQGFTDPLNDEAKSRGCTLFIFENIRFFIIQILTTSLQVLNKLQVSLIVLTNLVYFIHFIREIRRGKDKNIFSSPLLYWKFLIQELSILSVLTIIGIFGINNGPSFKETWIYQALEFILILGIVFTCFAELVIAIISIGLGVKETFLKRRRKTVKKKKRERLKLIEKYGFDWEKEDIKKQEQTSLVIIHPRIRKDNENNLEIKENRMYVREKKKMRLRLQMKQPRHSERNLTSLSTRRANAVGINPRNEYQKSSLKKKNLNWDSMFLK